jgi:hypothetical protein
VSAVGVRSEPMDWLRKLLKRDNPKPPPEPEPKIGDPEVESKHVREENRRKREGEMENGEGRRLEDV